MKTIKGLAMHVHHNKLFEYCYDYNERVNAIKITKPEKEQKIRLKLFKMLTQEAIAELPKNILKAEAEWDKAEAERDKARAECNMARAEYNKAWAKYNKVRAEYNKVRAKYDKAWAEYNKAWAEYDKAWAEYNKAWAKSWHTKYCGCKEWNGEKIIFS